MAEVWRELLGVKNVYVGDNFLDLGGHSLLAMRAISMMEKQTGTRGSLRSFVFQSLEQIAQEYDRSAPPSRADESSRATPNDDPRSTVTRGVPEVPTPKSRGIVRRLFTAFGKDK